MNVQEAEELHAEVRALRARLDELRTVPGAISAYEAALAEIEHGRVRLYERRQALRVRLSAARMPRAAPVGPGIKKGPPKKGPEGQPTRKPPSPPPRLVGDAAIRRRRTKSLINRFAVVWALDDLRLAEINRVADDRSRPLGEMIALLDWDAVCGPLPGGESNNAHGRRIEDWRDALREARDRLAVELRAVERQYADALDIWDQWRAPDGWREFLEAARSAKRQEVEALRLEIARLEQTLAEDVR